MATDPQPQGRRRETALNEEGAPRMSRNPPHDCDISIPPGVEAGLHETQAGAHRHVCIKHAYRAGYDAAVEEVNRDRRRSSWLDQRQLPCVTAIA
jgi:hypothetical protein